VEFLRQRAKMNRTKRGKKRAIQVTFSAHRSDVIGTLTRRDIYQEV
jgi:hypothetical protein